MIFAVFHTFSAIRKEGKKKAGIRLQRKIFDRNTTNDWLSYEV